MRKANILFYSGISFILCLLAVTQSEAGTALVYGRITDKSGSAAIASADVSIRVIGTPLPYSYGASFPGATKKVQTNSSGWYRALVDFPDIAEIAFALDVIKLDSVPFKGQSKQIDFRYAPPRNHGVYRLDFNLSDLTNCAIIQGYVEDRETGLSLNDFPIIVKAPAESLSNVTYCFKTDAKGFYRGAVDISFLPTSVTITASQFAFRQKIAYTPVDGPLKYAQQEKILSNAEPQKIYNFDFSLRRDKKAEVGYIIGRVIDATNAQPIPFAIVYTDGYGCGPATDFLGRYMIVVGSEGERKVSTEGAHTVTNSKSPYHRLQKITYVRQGEIKKVDFEMIPK